MDENGVKIPARFWKSVTQKEFTEVCENSELSAELCARLWRMLDRQDTPPDGLIVRLNAADVIREFPPRSS
jgi:hypothetical protein